MTQMCTSQCSQPWPGVSTLPTCLCVTLPAACSGPPPGRERCQEETSLQGLRCHLVNNVLIDAVLDLLLLSTIDLVVLHLKEEKGQNINGNQ